MGKRNPHLIFYHSASPTVYTHVLLTTLFALTVTCIQAAKYLRVCGKPIGVLLETKLALHDLHLELKLATLE